MSRFWKPATLLAGLLSFGFIFANVGRGQSSPAGYDDKGMVALREAYWVERRGDLTLNDLMSAQQYSATMPQAQGVPAAPAQPGNTNGNSKQPPTGTWTLLGPAPLIPETQVSTRATGRTISMVIQPGTSGANTVIYIGAANGGIWKTTNNGASWTPLTDTAAALAIGSLAMDPNNTQIVYAGLGEHKYNGNRFSGSGVLKTTNGGTNWTLLGNTFFGNRNSRIGRILINPNNSQHLYASTSIGLAVSTDGGATWDRNTTLPSAGVVDVVDIWAKFAVTPANNVLIALVSNNGLYRSTDNGANWTPITTNLPAPAGWKSRARIVSAPSTAGLPLNQEIMYLAVVNGASKVIDTGYNGMFYSTDGGATWTNMVSVTSDFTNAQGFYNLDMIVDPQFDDRLVFAGVDLWAVTDARGTSTTNYKKISRWDQNGTFGIHADHHILAWQPGCTTSPCRLFSGNDGGVDYTDNYITSGAVTDLANMVYTTLNTNTLAISQFIGGDIAPNFATSRLAFGGMQDNGTARYTNSTLWNERLGGDGGYATIDYNNTQIIYGMNTNESMSKSTNQGNTWNSATTGITTTNAGLFYTPYALDRRNSNHLVLGTNVVWETINGTTNWTQISNELQTESKISAVSIARYDSAIVYVGTNGGKVFKATNANTGMMATWTDVTGNLPGLYVNGIWINPNNPNEVYVGLGQFEYGQNDYIYKSTTGGTTWTSIHNNLPKLPVWSINSYQSVSGRVLVIGTDAGVYMSTNDGTTWSALNNGFPLTAVYQVSIDPEATSIVAWTHGRSAWWLAIPAAPVTRPDTIGVFKDGQWSLRNTNSTGAPDINALFGNPGDKPVVGDWNNDQIDTIGVFRNGLFLLSDSNTTPAVTYEIAFGSPGDEPLAGRWDNQTTGSGIGVYRPSNGVVYLRNSLTNGTDNYYLIFGDPGDKPVAGDWDANGYDGVGIYRSSNQTWYLRNNPGYGVAYSDIDFLFNVGTSAPIAGDWTATGVSRIGFFSTDGQFTLHSTLATAGTDNVFAFGPSDAKAVTGKWTASGSSPSALNGVIVNGAVGGSYTSGSDGNAD
jgi:hypothetical protein